MEQARADRQFAPLLLMFVGFWILQFSLLTLDSALMAQHDSWQVLIRRLVATGVGIVLSAGIWKLQQNLSRKSLWLRILATVGLSLVAATIHAAANFPIFHLRATPATYLSVTLTWFWCYVSVTGLLLAVGYSFEIEQRERDLVRVRQLAHEAQIRALRYQISPHFMFNSLNSVAALICTRENATAERMVENLGDFYRATLTIDPQDDHMLEDEMHLQRLYLDIETLRYPSRIRYRMIIEPRALKAMVPSLILQPLTENVFRHAVAKSSHLIELLIEGRIEGDRLLLQVRNSSPVGSGGRTHGTRVGLKNVEDRLRARFGSAQHFAARQLDDGAFLVQLEFPAEFGGQP